MRTIIIFGILAMLFAFNGWPVMALACTAVGLARVLAEK